MFILLISIIGIITYRHLHFSFSFSLSKFFCICLILTINQIRSKYLVMMGRTDSSLPPFCCSVFVFESFRVSGRQLTMAALVSIGIGLWLGHFVFHVASFHGLWDHICGRYCIIILAQFDPYETNNAHESELVCPRELVSLICMNYLLGVVYKLNLLLAHYLHLFRGIRLPRYLITSLFTNPTYHFLICFFIFQGFIVVGMLL
ncbi:hypothetical protein Hanom_Chr16g01441251 [Helianthus anomalus]